MQKKLCDSHPVKPECWYLVKFRKINQKPFVYERRFKSKKEAQKVCKVMGVKLGPDLAIMKGSQCIEYGLAWIHGGSKRYKFEMKGILPTKYKYPPDAYTRKDRRRFARQQRRNGIYF